MVKNERIPGLDSPNCHFRETFWIEWIHPILCLNDNRKQNAIGEERKTLFFFVWSLSISPLTDSKKRRRKKVYDWKRPLEKNLWNTTNVTRYCPPSSSETKLIKRCNRKSCRNTWLLACRVLWSTSDASDGDKWQGQSSQETECRKFNCITVDNQAPSAEPIQESGRFRDAMRDCI